MLFSDNGVPVLNTHAADGDGASAGWVIILILLAKCRIEEEAAEKNGSPNPCLNKAVHSYDLHFFAKLKSNSGKNL
jgi:hypothetical protein